jgi:hypothetical protein
MGEIKSTLDLVMEKTRNLTLSDEEKREHKQIEIESHIKGLLQKLQDELIAERQFQDEYQRLKTEFGQSLDEPLTDEIFSRLDPAGDTGILLNILNNCCHIENANVNSMIDDYRKSYQRAAEKRSLQIKELLATKYSISGSAVVPNLEADQEWRQQVQDMRGEFENQLSRLKAKFKDAKP